MYICYFINDEGNDEYNCTVPKACFTLFCDAVTWVEKNGVFATYTYLPVKG